MTDIDIYADEYTVKQQAKKAAVEQVKYSLDELISPDEVQAGAETWEDIDDDELDIEVSFGLETIINEGQIPAIKDLAVVLWRESLPRVPMDHLVFESQETAVKAGYWPYEMNRTEVTQLLWEYSDEYEYFHELEDEAESELGQVIEAAYHPLDEPDV